jgi:hypothetical protein
MKSRGPHHGIHHVDSLVNAAILLPVDVALTVNGTTASMARAGGQWHWRFSLICPGKLKTHRSPHECNRHRRNQGIDYHDLLATDTILFEGGPALYLNGQQPAVNGTAASH